jgi:predicted DNA-binding protein
MKKHKQKNPVGRPALDPEAGTREGVSFRLPADTREKIVKIAKRERRSQANVVVVAIDRMYEDQ